MIHNNAFYLFIINTGIVLATAYFLDLWENPKNGAKM
jgi:hypothetical protein